MSHIDAKVDRTLDLTEAACDELASPRDLEELDVILLADQRSRQYYLDYYRMHVALKLQLRARRAAENVQRHVNSKSVFPVPVDLSAGAVTVPSTVPAVFFGGTIHNAVGYFSSDWAVAYLVATVICGIGLLIGANVYVSQPAEVAKQLPSVIKGPALPDPQMNFVGQVTGMVDCQWADATTATIDRAHVPLGRKFALASGLMEITYNTGAKVILQGPVTYEVESATGGFLSVGKLTARLEKKVASGQWPVVSKSEITGPESLAANSSLATSHRPLTTIPNPQSPIPNPSLSTLHSPLFTIKTPTAVITDLGTEFGVEVNKEGWTASHVFRGSIGVQRAAVNGIPESAAEVLHANQSVRIERHGDQHTIVRVASATPADFVRKIPRPTITKFDLADVVAGGNGFSGRRNAGIDPRSGRMVSVPPTKRYFVSDGLYHRSKKGIPFVDGVFIINRGTDPTQLDSAGHTFEWFPNAQPNLTSGVIWAGKQFIATAELAGVDYDSPGHTLLELIPNKGITFDLEAIRRANPDYKILRFFGVAGNTAQGPGKNHFGCADMWVFVDGQVRFQRRQINEYSGAMPAVVPLGDKDRFLTLVATDGGDNIREDYTIFGDPRLELMSIKAAAGPSPPREAEH